MEPFFCFFGLFGGQFFIFESHNLMLFFLYHLILYLNLKLLIFTFKKIVNGLNTIVIK